MLGYMIKDFPQKAMGVMSQTTGSSITSSLLVSSLVKDQQIPIGRGRGDR